MKNISFLAFVMLAACSSSSTTQQTTSDGGTSPDSGGSADSGGGGACGAAQGSCTKANGSCEEIASFPASLIDSYKTDCMSHGSTFATTPCARTNAVGACQTNTGQGCIASWVYAPSDPATQKMGCASAGGTWLTP